ncbi:SpaA isopeptide-forming pilin-related protein [Marvinbryantia sp.]|uniref:SpaA isopeptide-forming pilin-related protein n=1 Tax=Marvinbryantia sp. TaxID=2496532 RepID=UPI0025DF6E2E|nr:SpaA isopeptide-forming pilin-related protein [uncultured Marvinbryantia sp.]
MKAWRKKLAGTFAAAVLTIACAAGSIVRAVQIETPDIDRSGSISIVMQDPETQNLVPGGTLTLYRVAAAKVKNGADYYFELTESFAESGERLVTLDAKLAERFSAYVKVKELKGDKQTADASGKVVFQNLDTGLYLLVQEDAAPGYYPVNPFLVTLPLRQDGEYIYEVDATPKMELTKKPEPPTEPETPAETEPPTEPSKTPGTEKPPATPPGKSDKPGNPVSTGDNTRVFFWSILAAGSLLAIAAIIILTKKRRNR